MARIDVNFTVEKQILTQTPETYLYTGSQDYFYAIFNVDATWGNVDTIKALFIKNGVSKIVELEKCDGGYGCDIPWQMYSTTGDFKVSIYDGERMSTNSIYVVVDEKDEIEVEESVENETYADRLMSHFSLRQVDRPDTFKIDGESRIITPPESFKNFGVESDENSNRIWFEVPQYVSDDIDLSTLNLYINFKNANGEKDKYIVEDADVADGVLYFSWVLSRKVTLYKGDISFIVCGIATNDEGEIETEWNTTLCTGPVLEGLEVDNPEVEIETVDLIDQLVSLVKSSVTTVENAVSQAEADIEFARCQAVADVNTAETESLDAIQNASDAAIARLNEMGVPLFANALKGTATGCPLILADVSPIQHDMIVTEDTGSTDIVRSGKNLLDIYGRTAGSSLGAYTNTTKRAFEYDKYYVGLTVNNYYDKTLTTAELVDGVWNVTAKQSGYSVAFPIKALPNTRYSCSGVYNGTLSMALYDGEGMFIKTQSSSSSFVTPENCETIVVCLVPSSKNETCQFSNVQLEFGSAKTEYEPYVEPVSYYSSIGGEPIKITSLYPTTVLYGEFSRVVTAEYNRDINKAFAELQNAVASLSNL